MEKELFSTKSTTVRLMFIIIFILGILTLLDYIYRFGVIFGKAL